MRHPSIRFRLMIGSGLLVAIVLLIANASIFGRIKRDLVEDVDSQLLQSASLLSKSAELDFGHVVYEWKEAMHSASGPPVTGFFQFWDVNAKTSERSPELGPDDLPQFHGPLNQPVLKDIVLHNGVRARAVGLLHYPFLDQLAAGEQGPPVTEADPSRHPQILVCAREIESLEKHLRSVRQGLIYTTVATVIGIWIAIYVISSWTLRPINQLSSRLLKRSLGEEGTMTEIPEKLPSELTELATAFGTTLARVEAARSHERDFALHAAHELRTPVAGIHATLEQALHRPRHEDDLRERIGTALDITSGMRGTIGSLMRLARLRGGIEKINCEPVDVASVLQAMIERDSQNYSGITVETHFESGTTSTDEGLFRILTENLLDNAFRHSPPGSTISLCAKVADGRFLFETNNPHGDLRAEDAARLFRPFQRGEQANADSAGAGLGLPLAKEIATLLGGSLEMSIRGERVTFSVTLPLSQAGPP